MSALVRYFLREGKIVAGYDRTPSELTSQLIKEGAQLHFEEELSAIPQECLDKESTLVVYTPAIPKGHKEWEYFRTETDLRRAVVKRLAEKYNLVFVPLQDMFDTVNADAPDGYWLSDGVHPTAAGHELIKRAWLDAFRKL